MYPEQRFSPLAQRLVHKLQPAQFNYPGSGFKDPHFLRFNVHGNRNY